MDTKNLKAFDLQGAREGKKVFNSFGEVFITELKIPKERDLVLISQDESGMIFSYHRADGTSDSNLPGYQLFMAPEEKEAWVNLYTPGSAHWYSSQELADSAVSRHRLGNKAHRITWTE